MHPCLLKLNPEDIIECYSERPALMQSYRFTRFTGKNNQYVVVVPSGCTQETIFQAERFHKIKILKVGRLQ